MKIRLTAAAAAAAFISCCAMAADCSIADAQSGKADPAEVFRACEKAAQNDNPEAMNTLGNLYARGLGVGQDYKKAVYWWGQALRDGNAEAMYHLGNAYALGQGVRPDIDDAWHLWADPRKKAVPHRRKSLAEFSAASGRLRGSRGLFGHCALYSVSLAVPPFMRP